MKQRYSPFEAVPESYRAMAGLQAYVSGSGLETSLRHLVTLHASQINGCAFCIAMHVREARQHGESNERLHLLSAWREAPIYSAREQAALAWTEALTLLADGHVPDEVYDTARAQFSEKELVELSLAVVAINGWNRMMVAFRRPPETKAANAAR